MEGELMSEQEIRDQILRQLEQLPRSQQIEVLKFALREIEGIHLVAPKSADAVEKIKMQRDYNDSREDGQQEVGVASQSQGRRGGGGCGCHQAIQQFCR